MENIEQFNVNPLHYCDGKTHINNRYIYTDVGYYNLHGN